MLAALTINLSAYAYGSYGNIDGILGKKEKTVFAKMPP